MYDGRHIGSDQARRSAALYGWFLLLTGLAIIARSATRTLALEESGRRTVNYLVGDLVSLLLVRIVRRTDRQLWLDEERR